MADASPVLVTTTPSIEGRRIVAYKGLVSGDDAIVEDTAPAVADSPVHWLNRILGR